jgi:hypothetical protein
LGDCILTGLSPSHRFSIVNYEPQSPGFGPANAESNLPPARTSPCSHCMWSQRRHKAFSMLIDASHYDDIAENLDMRARNIGESRIWARSTEPPRERLAARGGQSPRPPYLPGVHAPDHPLFSPPTSNRVRCEPRGGRSGEGRQKRSLTGTYGPGVARGGKIALETAALRGFKRRLPPSLHLGQTHLLKAVAPPRNHQG